MIELLKVIFLFLIAWQGPIVAIRAWGKLDIHHSSILLSSIGITGFVYLQFIM